VLHPHEWLIVKLVAGDHLSGNLVSGVTEEPSSWRKLYYWGCFVITWGYRQVAKGMGRIAEEGVGRKWKGSKRGN
jgi:hypothetical protein